MSANNNKIDAKEASRLFQECGSWQEVADIMHRPDGSHWTRSALYQAVYHAGLPTNRYGQTRGGTAWAADGQIYQPLPPRPISVIPDYARNTIKRL